MNESDWLACDDPQIMVSYLEGKTSDRKLRLFACACCRRYWTFLLEPASQRAVEVAERFADDLATLEELTQAHEQALAILQAYPSMFVAPACEAAVMVMNLAALDAVRATLGATRAMAVRDAAYAGVPGFDERRAVEEALAAELCDQCELLRHIVGNPFRPVAIDPKWLRWDGGVVGKMARVIYDEGQFEDLPFLADALMDAGCDNEEILEHCRTPRDHIKGCWVVDALLQRT
jgi:hypothetical protein